uniref:Uncharacterized protein n=1 Tax=Anguilla anguilla TaxID=7936 RepID=A0A0E9UYI6_ANGAN
MFKFVPSRGINFVSLRKSTKHGILPGVPKLLRTTVVILIIRSSKSF